MDKDQIRQIQEDYELSNMAFAESLGVSLSLVEKWRNGNRDVQSYHERAILEKYGVKLRLKKRRR